MAKAKVKKAEAEKLMGELAATAPADLRQVAYEVLHQWGGHKGMAKKIIDLYEASNPGGMTQAKIMADILGALRFASDKDGGKEELSLLSEEDLDKTAGEMLTKVIDGKSKEKEGQQDGNRAGREDAQIPDGAADRIPGAQACAAAEGSADAPGAEP